MSRIQSGILFSLLFATFILSFYTAIIVENNRVTESNLENCIESYRLAYDVKNPGFKLDSTTWEANNVWNQS